MSLAKTNPKGLIYLFILDNYTLLEKQSKFL